MNEKSHVSTRRAFKSWPANQNLLDLFFFFLICLLIDLKKKKIQTKKKKRSQSGSNEHSSRVACVGGKKIPVYCIDEILPKKKERNFKKDVLFTLV